MLNHGRTLLANQKASNVFGDQIAEEVTPAAFVPLVLPAYVQRVRATLFGTDPDRDFINYRCRQFLTVLHRTPWAAYLTDLDPRLTYQIGSAVELVPAGTFGVTVTQLAGTPADLAVFGRPAAPDPTGHCSLRYTVTVLSSANVRIARSTPPAVSTIETFAMTSGLSDVLPLVGSGYSFRLTANDTDMAWIIRVLNRPQWDVGTLLADAATLPADVDRLLDGPEPYRTFRNLWTQQELPGRLAGLVLGLIYRTNELWKEATGAAG